MKQLFKNIFDWFKMTQLLIPQDAINLEVFAVKTSEDSLTGKVAFIGYTTGFGNFDFVQVPYIVMTRLQAKNWAQNRDLDVIIIKDDEYFPNGKLGFIGYITGDGKITYNHIKLNIVEIND